MANHLDLEEQEQLDQLKHFWKQYGNIITWALIVVLGAFASWNFYQYWQRTQAVQAAALFEEVDRAAHSADVTRIDRVFADMKDRFPSTVYAHQSGLLVAKQYAYLGKPDSAVAALTWVAEKSPDSGYKSVAKLRLAALLIEAKKFDAALSQLEGAFDPSFDALVADRKGDIYVLQGNKAKAVAEYQKAYRLFDARTEYRRLVEVKLNAQGMDIQLPDSISAVTGK
jgi:predicted negative regulator of RcsB-dependent stress response